MEKLNCPDHDFLLTLQQASDGELIALARHLSACPECGGAAAEIERLRTALAATSEPRPGFTAEVLGSITAPTSERARRASPIDVLNIALAGLAAMLAIAISSTGSPAGASAAAVIAGGIVAAACYGLSEALEG